jgi:type I restriction enzyme S subunit
LKSELVEVGIPFLGIDNIFTERFVGTFKRFVPERKFRELIRYAVKPKDVVITIMGTVGRCCVIPDDIGRALSSKHIWCMSFNQKMVIPDLICWQLNYAPWVLNWFRKHSQGAVMDAIQSSTLRTLNLPIPPMPEQEVIFKKYNAIQELIKNEQKLALKLERMKSGLMHDLLTGRVRVKVLGDGPQEAAA